jgi:hypothetical protein
MRQTVPGLAKVRGATFGAVDPGAALLCKVEVENQVSSRRVQQQVEQKYR